MLIILPLWNCAGSSQVTNCLECILSWLSCTGKFAKLDISCLVLQSCQLGSVYQLSRICYVFQWLTCLASDDVGRQYYPIFRHFKNCLHTISRYLCNFLWGCFLWSFVTAGCKYFHSPFIAEARVAAEQVPVKSNWILSFCVAAS